MSILNFQQEYAYASVSKYCIDCQKKLEFKRQLTKVVHTFFNSGVTIY